MPAAEKIEVKMDGHGFMFRCRLTFKSRAAEHAGAPVHLKSG